MRSEAVSGPFIGTLLEQVPLQHTIWANWKEQFQNSLLLGQYTGFTRKYTENPYGGINTSDGLYFSVKFKAAGLHPKEQVIGLEWIGQTRAWTFIELRK